MTKLLRLLELLLLFTAFKPIVCPSSEMLISRRDRASITESDQLSTVHDMRSKKSQLKSTQNQHYDEHTKSQSMTASDSPFGIFYVGDEKGVVLFNNTTSESSESNLHGDHDQDNGHGSEHDAFLDRSSNQEQAFKVQRSPDGKLNVVFNEFLFFQKPSETHNAHRTKNDAIIFPDRASRPYSTRFAGIVPDCGGQQDITEEKPFCTEVRNYPTSTDLESLLKRELAKFEVFFGEDLAQPQNVTQRMNYEPDEENLCRSVEKIIYPKAGLTKDSIELLIVNNNDKFKQGVRIEECVNEGEQCHVIKDILPNNYRATCKQNYIYRSLVAISHNGTLKQDQFRMPSCCKCVLKQVRN